MITTYEMRAPASVSTKEREKLKKPQPVSSTAGAVSMDARMRPSRNDAGDDDPVGLLSAVTASCVDGHWGVLPTLLLPPRVWDAVAAFA